MCFIAVCTFCMFSVFVLKMRAVPVEVVRAAPHTGPLPFALGTGVVRVPLLALEALIWACSRGALTFINSLNAFVVLISKKHSAAKHPLLDFLIFKTDDYFVDFGPFFPIKKSGDTFQFKVVSCL